MYRFSVCTPTYNRSNRLTQLYNSLKRQKFNNFEWIIIDDGSIDDTQKIIQTFIEEGDIDIKYIKKNNGGKHTAVNKGIKIASGELFIVVDSDDYLCDDALYILNEEWQRVRDKNDIGGIVALCEDEKDNIIGSEIPSKYDEIKFSDLYYKHNVKGDKAVMFTTDIMKRYMCPEPKDIKFISEAVIWDKISKKYKVKCINKVIKKCEYLRDGYTKGKPNIELIKGMGESYLLYINENLHPFKLYPFIWIRNHLNLIRFGLVIKENYLTRITKMKSKITCILLFPVGYVLYIRHKNIYGIIKGESKHVQ